MTLYTTFESPIGELLAVGDGVALTELHMQGGRTRAKIDPSWRRDDAAFASVREQLDDYFAGTRRSFDLPLSMAGGEFERRVWDELLAIPYGEIAVRVGNPGAARAVGLANGRNPIAVIVPCHRVIGADGSLTGYGGGLERKRRLLDLEAGVLPLEARDQDRRVDLAAVTDDPAPLAAA